MATLVAFTASASADPVVVKIRENARNVLRFDDELEQRCGSSTGPALYALLHVGD